MITTPPFLLGAALLFWGAQTGHIVIGALMAAVLESSRWIKVRWNLSQSDFDRLWNICTVLFLGAAVFLFFDEGTISFNDFFVDAGRRPEAIREKGRAALLLFQWFPMLFFPFMAAQALSDSRGVDLATFSWLLRRRRRREQAGSFEQEKFNASFVYFAACLFAASATNRRTIWFFAGLTALITWALWSQRSRRFPAIIWACLLALVTAGGYGGHLGLTRLQAMLEQAALPWFSRSEALGLDRQQTRTFMGRIGRLKQSNRIVLRLQTDGQRPPELLRETTYNLFRGRMWFNQGADTRGINSETNNTSWILATNVPAARQVTVAKYTSRAEGLLAVPLGVAALHRLPVGLLELSGMGALKVGGAPGLLFYDVRYGKDSTIDSPPLQQDRESVEAEEPAIARVALELGLNSRLAPPEALRRVNRFFQENFEYARYLDASHRATSNETVLARFLLSNRRGHCEYFATATTLLLRKAGLPTRYAVGYSVQEGSGKKHLVRERHAHAWTLVYYDNAWHDFDTTPASWDAHEAKHASWFLPVKDFFSDLWFQFSKWRWSSVEWRKYLMWAPAPLLVFALASFVFKRQWRNLRGRKEAAAPVRSWPGEDSELYDVEKTLAREGLNRRVTESWSDWLTRVRERVRDAGTLEGIVRLHQRYRFDPRGLDPAERTLLRTGARAYRDERTP